MFKTIFISVVFVWSVSAYASIVNNNNTVDETPYEWLVRSHAEKPIDFIGLAAEAAEMRARYNRTCLNILLSDELSTDDKYDFNLRLDPSDNYRLMLYEKKYSEGFSLVTQQLRSLLAYNSLAGRVTVEDSSSAPEVTLVERMLWLARSADIWEFLARSLKSYRNEGSPKDIAFTDQLLLEGWMVLAEAITGLWEAKGRVQESLKFDSKSVDVLVTDKRLSDELRFGRCVLESILLHRLLVMKVNIDEHPLQPIIYDDLLIKSVADLGENFSLCLVYDKLSNLSGLNNAVLKERKSKLAKQAKVGVGVKEEGLIDLKDRLEHQGYLNNSFVHHHSFDQNELKAPLLKDPKIRAFAPEFTLTSKCLSFEAFYKPLLEVKKQKDLELKAAERAAKQKALEATKDSRANSFLTSMPAPRKPQKEKKKSSKKPVRAGVSKQASKDIDTPQVPPVTASAAVAPKEEKKKIKLPTSKQKREAKNAAKQEELNRILTERMAVADRNEQTQKRMIESVQVEFGSAQPSLEELNLYSKIWGPASQRKTLSWGELRSQLEGYGWSFATSDGAFVIMTPPDWFNHVKVTADPVLQINFHYSKFMIHKPHDDALAPMPVYVIAFLRTELAGAIGLSEIVVNAMIKEIHKKK